MTLVTLGASHTDELDRPEFIADEIEIPPPELIASTDNFCLLSDLNTFWLYRRSNGQLHIMGCIAEAELNELMDVTGRAMLDIESCKLTKASAGS